MVLKQEWVSIFQCLQNEASDYTWSILDDDRNMPESR